jgi:integral membrane protein (TIGR01906 family)
MGGPMRHFKFSDILVGIIFTLLFISIAVVFTINFRPLYYIDVNLLNVGATSGMERTDILLNYNALIDYCSPLFTGSLMFPTLEASQNGLQHFAEVKNIFVSFYYIGIITLVFGVTIMIQKHKNREFGYLLVSAITAIVLPSLLGLYMAMDFDRAFLLFHKLFFRNDYWMFDPVTDPVILILPEDFFMHCAIMIISIVLLFSVAFIITYFWKKNHSSIKYRKNKGLKL